MRIMVFGTFDNLHPGHAFVFGKARKRGQVTAIVARDSNVERIKGRRPKQSEAERMAAIRSEFPDVTVILGDEVDFLAPIRERKPDLILLGYDQHLPPGVTEADLPCSVERLPAHEPKRYKSSLL